MDRAPLHGGAKKEAVWHTWNGYPFKDVFGYKTSCAENGKMMANFVWCQGCAVHKSALIVSPDIKGGEAKIAVIAFINSLVKHQVCMN